MKKSKEFKLKRKIDEYIQEYVPVRLNLPKRKLATASDYFKNAPRGKGWLR